MSKKTKIFESLNRSVLLEIVQAYELIGLTGKSKAEILSALEITA